MLEHNITYEDPVNDFLIHTGCTEQSSTFVSHDTVSDALKRFGKGLAKRSLPNSSS